MSQTHDTPTDAEEPSGDVPDPDNWGTETRQTADEWPDTDAMTHNERERHTDAAEIRRRFGLAPFDPVNYDFPPYPDLMIHESAHEDRGTGQTGGTNFLATAGLGSGKSTFALYISRILMGINNEAVVWRGSPRRSEWLPFKPWTRLFLPANARYSAQWRPEDKTAEWESRPANIHNEVREIIRYESPHDVTTQLEPGTFNVVYPDPSFSGCDRAVRESETFPGETTHVPSWRADDEGEETPLVHWWFAWCFSRVEKGPYDFSTLIFDETGDFAEEDSAKDENDTYQKVDAMRSVITQSRKFNFSLFFFAHNEEDLHHKIRRPIQWRIDMGKKSPNRVSGENEVPIGFDNIPMNRDMLQGKGVGHAVVWDELHFNRITWDDIPSWPEDRRRQLQINLGRP